MHMHAIEAAARPTTMGTFSSAHGCTALFLTFMDPEVVQSENQGKNGKEWAPPLPRAVYYVATTIQACVMLYIFPLSTIRRSRLVVCNKYMFRAL